MDYDKGLYLDCSKDGSRKNQVWNYHLFRVDDDGFHLLQTVENNKRRWACEFWETIESELANSSESQVGSADIVNMIYQHTRDKKIISEIVDKLGEDCGRNAKYYLTGSFGKTCTKGEFESFLNFNGLLKVTSKGLEHFEDRAIEKINEHIDFTIDQADWGKELLISELYCLIRADFSMKRCDYSKTWMDDIKEFRVNGFYYEYKDNCYVLITKGLDDVKYALVELRR